MPSTLQPNFPARTLKDYSKIKDCETIKIGEKMTSNKFRGGPCEIFSWARSWASFINRAHTHFYAYDQTDQV